MLHLTWLRNCLILLLICCSRALITSKSGSRQLQQQLPRVTRIKQASGPLLSTAMQQQICVYLRSFREDLEPVLVVLKSIDTHLPARGEVVLNVDKQDVPIFQALVPTGVRISGVTRLLQGYMQQQLDKMLSDTLCSKPFLLQLDSDTVLTHPMTEMELFRAGKPVHVYAPYSAFPPASNVRVWQNCTASALKRPVEHEFMRTPYRFYPTDLLVHARQHLQRTHGMSMLEFIRTRSERHEFSEYNYLGAYFFYYHHEAFVWIKDVTHQNWRGCQSYWKVAKRWPDFREEYLELLNAAITNPNACGALLLRQKEWRRCVKRLGDGSWHRYKKCKIPRKYRQYQIV